MTPENGAVASPRVHLFVVEERVTIEARICEAGRPALEQMRGQARTARVPVPSHVTAAPARPWSRRGPQLEEAHVGRGGARTRTTGPPRAAASPCSCQAPQPTSAAVPGTGGRLPAADTGAGFGGGVGVGARVGVGVGEDIRPQTRRPRRRRRLPPRPGRAVSRRRSPRHIRRRIPGRRGRRGPVTSTSCRPVSIAAQASASMTSQNARTSGDASLRRCVHTPTRNSPRSSWPGVVSANVGAVRGGLLSKTRRHDAHAAAEARERENRPRCPRPRRRSAA